MKNIWLPFFVSVLLVKNSFGQIEFQKTIGGANSDIGQSIQQTSDGGYIMAGYTSSFGAGGSDVYLVKADAVGNITWAKTYGGAADDIGKCVRQTTDGGYIVGGWTSSFGQGSTDFYYFKTDAAGSLVWSKAFGGIGLDLVFSVQQTADGGYAFYGWTASYGAGDGDFYLVKTDANGTVLWNHTYGWSGDEYGLSFQQTADHGYIMTGTCNTFGAGGFDMLIIKADSAGNEQWAKVYGGSMNDGGSFIQQTSDGGYIDVGGTPSFGAGSSDVYLVRTDANGDTLWTRTYGNVNKDGGNCVRQDSNGNFIISATFASGATSQGWLFKTDGNGTVLWNKFYGGVKVEDSFTFWKTNDGGYALTGQTTSFGAGMEDVFLMKTDSNGESGCDQTTVQSAITGLPHTIVTDSVPLVMSGGISINPATVVHSGGIVDSLCATAANVPFPSFQSNDSTICEDDCINFTDLSTNNPTSWQWSFPGATVTSSTNQNPQHICYLTAGTYGVTLVAGNANGSNSLTLNNFIVVNPAPPTPIIMNMHDTLLFCHADSSYILYQWYDGLQSIPGATDTSIRINHAGNYNLQVTNSKGCSIAVGINVVGINEFTVYDLQFTVSNPVSSELIIKNEGLRIEKTEIYNILGERIFSESEIENRKSEILISVSALPAGIYFLQLKWERGTAVKKFVKE